jgi:hypothetical protein
MKRPNITPGDWQAKIHRDMTPSRTKVETRDTVVCDTLGNEADAIACAAVPDLLKLAEKALKADFSNLMEMKFLAQAALLKAGYTF